MRPKEPHGASRDEHEDVGRLHHRNRLHRVERPDETSAYSLDTESLVVPVLPGEVAAARELDDVLDVLAADVVVQATNCVRTFGDCHIALSGDPLLEPLYERLMYDPNCRSLPWKKVHLWVVDEALVAFDDARCAFRLVRETIVDHSDIPPEQVHPIFPLGESPAETYEAQLREVLAWREKGQDRLDVVLLAAGIDGGVAGLAPGSTVLHEPSKLVVLSGRARSAPDAQRVTMTLGLLNASRFLGVMATGSGRADVVRRMTEGHEPFEALPLKGLHPLGGTLKWYLDAGAAGGSGLGT